MFGTVLALFTILMWSTLILLSVGVRHLPVFLCTGVALCIGGLVGLVKVRDWSLPPWTFVMGVGGIFGAHALFFAALRHAPAVEVNLLQYLWPLLIVVLSPLYLKSSRLAAHHIVGGLLGLAGAALVISGGRLRPDLAHLPGYLLAVAPWPTSRRCFRRCCSSWWAAAASPLWRVAPWVSSLPARWWVPWASSGPGRPRLAETHAGNPSHPPVGWSQPERA